MYSVRLDTDKGAWVASVITSPAAPMANWPRCMRCQSLAEPLSDMYWHMDETTARLGSVSPRSWNGVKSALVIRAVSVGRGGWSRRILSG